MNWAIWQQHKKQFLILGGVLLAVAAFMIPTGNHYWHVYQHALASCTATTTTAACNAKLSNELFLRGITATIFDVIRFVMVAAPAFLGIFFGLSLIGREYTDGTNLLAWTQGVSRRTWLTAKMAWILAVTALAAGIITALHTWWWRTGNDLYLTRFQPLDFVVQGFVPVAITIYAVSVAISFGAWFRRTLPALGALLVIIIMTQSFIPMFARPHYTAQRLYKSALYTIADKEHRPDQAPMPPGKEKAWITNSVIVNNQGKTLDWANPPHECSHTVAEIEHMREAQDQQTANSGQRQASQEPESFIDREGGPAVSMNCIAKKGYHWEVRYQPANQYWMFQAIESALYLALSIPFVAFTYWLVLRRDV